MLLSKVRKYGLDVFIQEMGEDDCKNWIADVGESGFAFEISSEKFDSFDAKIAKGLQQIIPNELWRKVQVDEERAHIKYPKIIDWTANCVSHPTALFNQLR